MSDALIDVSWRGLEVGRQVPLREVTDGQGRVDVPMPMPVGSAVSVRAGEGLELAAIVVRVHEQSSSGGETAGMVIVPTLDDAGRAWWSARAAETAAGPPAEAASSVEDEPVMIVAPADPAARPTMVFGAVTAEQMVAAIAAATPTPVQVVAAPPVRVGAADTDGAAAIAQLPTAAISVEELQAARAAAIADAAADLADADPDAGATMPLPAATRRPAPASDDRPDDTSQTSIMAAVDIEAIMAESASGDGAADDSGVVEAVGSETSNGTSESGPRGKGKAGARGKKRKGR